MTLDSVEMWSPFKNDSITLPSDQNDSLQNKILLAKAILSFADSVKYVKKNRKEEKIIQFIELKYHTVKFTVRNKQQFPFFISSNYRLMADIFLLYNR